MTDLVERLRKIDAEMTPGPWEQADEWHVRAAAFDMEGNPGRWVAHCNARMSDAAGIAALRNALPAIIAALAEPQP